MSNTVYCWRCYFFSEIYSFADTHKHFTMNVHNFLRLGLTRISASQTDFATYCLCKCNDGNEHQIARPVPPRLMCVCVRWGELLTNKIYIMCGTVLQTVLSLHLARPGFRRRQSKIWVNSLLFFFMFLANLFITHCALYFTVVAFSGVSGLRVLRFQ